MYMASRRMRFCLRRLKGQTRGLHGYHKCVLAGLVAVVSSAEENRSNPDRLCTRSPPPVWRFIDPAHHFARTHAPAPNSLRSGADVRKEEWVRTPGAYDGATFEEASRLDIDGHPVRTLCCTSSPRADVPSDPSPRVCAPPGGSAHFRPPPRVAGDAALGDALHGGTGGGGLPGRRPRAGGGLRDGPAERLSPVYEHRNAAPLRYHTYYTL